MQSGIEGDRKALLGFLSAIIELDRIFKAACRDGSMIAGYLRGIRITQVPLERVHPGLDRSELRFLFSDLLICGLPAVVHFRRGLSQMRAGQPFGLLFFFLFFVFCCEMQRKAANYLSLSIGELEGCRSLAIVVLRNVEEYSCTERRVIAGIGRTSFFGLGKTVIVSQPRFLGSEQETGVRLNGGVLGQLLEKRQIIKHPK